MSYFAPALYAFRAFDAAHSVVLSKRREWGGARGHATCIVACLHFDFSDDFPTYIIRRAGVYTVRLVLLIVGVLRDEISIPDAQQYN